MIDEHDINHFLYELAQWLASQNLHADIVLDGGGAMLVQTHLRESTSDVDFMFKNVRTASGRPIPVFRYIELQEQFAAQSSLPIDMSYAKKMTRDIHDGFEAFPEALPLKAMNDNQGCGLHTEVATLDYIYRMKMSRIFANPTSYPKYLVDLRDAYGLYIILVDDWDGVRSTGQEKAYLGPRPKWEFIYPPDQKAPLPPDESVIERRARYGRKPFAFEHIELKFAERIEPLVTSPLPAKRFT
jgi:hypothetical protein